MVVRRNDKRDDLPLLSLIVNSKDPGPLVHDILAWAIPVEGTEVVFVDDLSKDGSVNVIQRHLALAPSERFRLVSSNGRGLGPARNVGISSARGTFVAFADVDDVAFTGVLADAAAQCERLGADIAVCSYVRLDLATGQRRRYDPTEAGLAIDPRGSKVLLERAAVWGKVYRRSALSSSDSFFPDDPGAEDVRFTYVLATKRLRTLLIPEVAYEYRIARAGQKTGSEQHFTDAARTLTKMLDDAPTGAEDRALLAYSVASSIPRIVQGIGGLRGTIEGLRIGSRGLSVLGPFATFSGVHLGIRNRIRRRGL